MYLLHLIHNIIYIIKYTFKEYIPEKDINIKNGKYAMIMAMIQLLKFDINIIEHNKYIYKNNIKDNSKISDIDLIISHKKKIIYIEVKYVSNNLNNDYNLYLADQITRQKEAIGVTKPLYILYIYGVKLLDMTESIIKNEHPDIHIFYNKISSLPSHQTNNIVYISHSICGFICTYHHSDFAFKKLMDKLSKFELYTYVTYFEQFDLRMNNSRNLVERERWDILKQKINVIYDEDMENIKYSIYDLISGVPSRIRASKGYDRFKCFRYAFINDFKCLCMNHEVSNQNKYLNILMVENIPIYGSHHDNRVHDKNWFVRNAYFIYYKIYIWYFIFFVTI